MSTSEHGSSTSYRYLSGERVGFEAAVSSLAGTHTPYCWGCGPEAKEGLGLRPELDGTDVVADLMFAPRFEGGPGTVHGGAIAAFMDDILGYVPVAFGAPGVTATLETNFRLPVPLGVHVTGRAWLSRVEGRKMWAEGVIEADGDVLVESSAMFVAIDPSHYQDVIAGLTDEQRRRNITYRSGDYYP
ncbi:MAG: PaaI family thioesterase [Acidimicrobiia bacterium]